MKKLQVLILLVLVSSTGCVRMPKTTARIPTDRGTIFWQSPQDAEVTGLEVDFVNGTLKVKEIKRRTNPDVIAETGVAQLEMLKTLTQLVDRLGQMSAAYFSGRPPVALLPSSPSQPSPQ